MSPKQPSDVKKDAAIRRYPDYRAFVEVAARAMAGERTLLGRDRLYVLWQAARNTAPLDGVAVEIGTYRGGSARFLGEALRSLRGRPAELHVLDTFTGHVPQRVTAADTDAHREEVFTDTSADDVRAYLEAALEDVHVHAGDAVELLPQVLGDDRRVACCHLDVDLYEPTLACLEVLSPRLVAGGVVVVDDYAAKKTPGVEQAVAEHLARDPDLGAWTSGTEQVVLVKRGG